MGDEVYMKQQIDDKLANGFKCIKLKIGAIDFQKELDLLRKAVNQLQLSARAYHRIIKIARTIADLAGSESIEIPHLAEAIQYRQRRT